MASASSFWDRNRPGDDPGNRRADSRHVADNHHEAGSRRVAADHIRYVAGSRPHLVADNHPHHTADGDVVGNHRVADNRREADSRYEAADHIDDGAGSRVHAEECYWSDQHRIPQDGNRPLLDCHYDCSRPDYRDVSAGEYADVVNVPDDTDSQFVVAPEPDL